MNEKIKKIAIFSNLSPNNLSVSAKRIISSLQERGAEITFVSADDMFQSADIVISMGGDGTFLNAAAYVGNHGTPILGINTGHLGFLSFTDPQHYDNNDDLDRLFDGDYNIEERSLIYVAGNGMPLSNKPFALNDVAILKRDNASMISIRTSINGEYLTTFLSDGLIVSTPTGSTAYSLSAGGPIVVPNANTLSLVAVAPHSLNIRPIVITDDSVIDIKVESRNDSFLVGIDGRSIKCDKDTDISICKAPYTIRVVSSKEKSFFSTMREKLHLGARNITDSDTDSEQR